LTGCVAGCTCRSKFVNSPITPTGTCQAYLPYVEEGVLVQAIDIDTVTGLLARRFAAGRYGEEE
jgi:hypothetical protein